MMSEETQKLKDNVSKTKDEFITAVNTMNYVIKIMNESPQSFMDSSLTKAIINVEKTYEDYINSRIKFTDKYFQEIYNP